MTLGTPSRICCKSLAQYFHAAKRTRGDCLAEVWASFRWGISRRNPRYTRALKGVRIHDLRHTHASIGAGAGLGLPIIGKLLGHSQSSTTARYAHLDADPLRRASEVIAGRIAAAMGEVPRRAAEVLALKRGSGTTRCDRVTIDAGEVRGL